MHHHTSILKKASLTLLSAFVAVSVHAEPNEVVSQTLKRTAADGLTLQSRLIKNAYRQEPYQDNYTVQIPYQDTETYYVDVPYQDQEAYTDYETYYDNDYICHDYTDYESRCHMERDCNLTPNIGIQRTAGAGDVVGRPRDPGTGPAPYDPGSGSGPITPTPVCRDRQVCENVPVTKQRCGYEQVAKQRAVTKYRTVTKYRSEARTRDVTRYREEQRCCVTRYHDVYDHQWGVSVQVRFPQGTELNSGEAETFQLEIAGTEAAPDVKLTPATTIFGYKIASKTVDKGVATIVLAQVPRYKAADLAEKSLQNFTATPTLQGLTYKFFDNAILPRVSSRSQILIQDAATHQVMKQTDVMMITQRENGGNIALNWDYTRNYEVVLKVHREGSVIENGVVDFELRQPLQMILDMDALKSDSRITPGLTGSLDRTQVTIVDNTVPYITVQTRYYISLVRKNFFGVTSVIAEKGFSRTSLKAGANGVMAISIADFGMKASDINSYLKSGEKLQIVVQVDRSTSDGKKIQFFKSANVEIR